MNHSPSARELENRAIRSCILELYAKTDKRLGNRKIKDCLSRDDPKTKYLSFSGKRIGVTSAWFPSRKSVLHQMGAFVISLDGHIVYQTVSLSPMGHFY